jgi:hypothetical protein
MRRLLILLAATTACAGKAPKNPTATPDGGTDDAPPAVTS